MTAGPKFLGSSTEDAYSYRDRALAVLRVVQLRAMQNTALDSCHTLYITNNLIAGPTVDTCSGGPDATNSEFLVVQIDSGRSDVQFSAVDGNGNGFNQISFDELGRIDKNCSTRCRIDVSLAAVCISGEGLIYACP